MPVSTTAVTNTTSHTVAIYINGGTISGVLNANGTSINQAPPITVILEPSGTISITYSSAPSWVWQASR